MGVNGIYGLASGLDIDSLVTQAMTGKQSQYDSIYKKEQKAEWTKDAYNTWYNKLLDFQNNTLYKYALSSGMDPKTATSSDTSVVTATAGGAASSMSHQVTINSLASNAYLKSKTDISSMKLSDLLGFSNLSLTSSTADTASSDTLTYSYTDSDGTAHSVKLTGADMDKTAISFTLKDGTTKTNADDSTTADTSATISFTYRDLAEGTLNDFVDKINDAGTNIAAQYDSVNDTFSIYNKIGGSTNTLSLTVNTVDNDLKDEDGNSLSNTNTNTRTLLGALNLAQYKAADNSLGTAISGNDFANTTDSADVIKDKAYLGTNGSVTVDGKTYDKVTGTQFSVDGVTYNLVSASQTGKTTTITIGNDTDTVVKNVQQFVTDYNTLLTSLKDVIYEEPDSDYQPLTTAEKKAMTEDQITQWETKAKTGLLYKDDTLSDLVDSMRSAVNTSVAGLGGNYTSLASIGITVSADWAQDSSGLLSVDTDKLKKALSDDPDIAYKLFANPAADANDSTTSGIVKRLNTSVASALGSGSLGTDATGLLGDAGKTDSSNYADQSYWGNRIKDLKDQLDSFKDAMDKYQSSLYDQFDAMETAISNLNTQYSYISSFSS